MAHKHVSGQSLRPNGGSALYQKLRAIRYPVPKLLLPLFLLLIAAAMHHWQLNCLWQELLSIPCPGCGMTRALLAALHGDMTAAFRYHFMVPSLPLLYLYLLFDGQLFSKKWLNNFVLGGILAGFFLHWVRLLCSA